MSADPVRAIADAVLYEGYVLWPYRRSALKNQQRFTFGGVYPRGWPEGPSRIRSECLLRCEGEPRVEVGVRFLHLIERQLHDAGGAPVDELSVGGERQLSWEESTERETAVRVPGRTPVEVPAGSREERLRGPGGAVEGGVVRRWQRLRGSLVATGERLEGGLYRIAVEVANDCELEGAPRAEVLKRTFCSTHAVLRAETGEFLSLTDPPPEHAAAAAGCRNEGLWPVLVGEPPDRSTLLASPIILEDYPRVAPESPGDLFDGGEIDQLLTLNILALSDEERAEMRGSDPRAREILERTEALSREQLMRLHGTSDRDFGTVR